MYTVLAVHPIVSRATGSPSKIAYIQLSGERVCHKGFADIAVGSQAVLTERTSPARQDPATGRTYAEKTELWVTPIGAASAEGDVE